jgi:aryl-alcohol dehydrogenase-like predicted oxidoreductase
MSVETRTLGRTHLTVSLLGLGTGGNSRLGLARGLNEEHAAGVVRAALNSGITMLDTARVYGTERAVGLALRGWPRDRIVLSSKSPYRDANGELLTAQAFQANLETSLLELGVEVIDIYFIHGLALPFYEASRDRLLPVLQRARQAGKIRFIGITEAFERDFGHEMLTRALQDDDWDVMMVGFNFLNPSARQRILTRTRQKGIGTLGMFAVRRGLIDETWLRILLNRLADRGEIDPELASAPDLMDSLGLRGVSSTLSEAAYRFCAYAPGLDCTLSGTGSAEHLSENLSAVQRGPLPETTLARLEQLFGQVDSLSGQVIIDP